jgi:hypothetical protein
MLKLNAFYAALILSSFNVFGIEIGLCPGTPPYGVIPCDSACTGASASKMSAQFALAEIGMAAEFNKLNSEWIEVGNSDSDLFSSYMLSKKTSSDSRVTAYSATESKISSAITITSKGRESLMDKLISVLYTVGDNRKSYSEQKYIGLHHGPGEGSTRIPFMLSNSVIMSDPINNKTAHTEILIGWNDVIKKYNYDEASLLALTNDDASLSMIAMAESKLSLSVSSEISKLLAFRHLYKDEVDSISSRNNNTKDMLAIDLLLQSFDVDPLVSEANTGISISKNWLVSIESQKGISQNKPRDLSIDLVVGQGIENVLLNDYLSIKRSKNLVRALN